MLTLISTTTSRSKPIYKERKQSRKNWKITRPLFGIVIPYNLWRFWPHFFYFVKCLLKLMMKCNISEEVEMCDVVQWEALGECWNALSICHNVFARHVECHIHVSPSQIEFIICKAAFPCVSRQHFFSLDFRS